MYVKLQVDDIKLLRDQNMARQISRWESIEKAKSYYSNEDGLFTAFEEEESFIKSALSTPVFAFQLKEKPTN